MSLPLFKGYYRDRILAAQVREVDRGWRPNLVVDRCRVLLAAFMRGDRSTGIRFLLVGRGLPEWDETAPPPPQRSDEALLDPRPVRLPVGIEDIQYLNVAGELSAEPTARIQVSMTLEPGQPPIPARQESCPLREFGLVGRMGRQDFMIDYVRHPVIHKRADDTLVRTIRLIF